MRRILALVLFAALAVLAHGAWRWAGGHRGEAEAGAQPASAAVSAAAGGAVAGQDGPGLKPVTAASLQLSVPRTPDLAHVDPTPFAAALGHDPVRIFEFVRDQVAYEPYAGCLRGPRGTLLALAGNAVDRSSLLAAMLGSAKQRTRFAQGRLPDDRARELVASIFVEHAASVPPASPVPGVAKAAADAIAAGVTLDGRLLAASLKGAGLPPRAEATSLESLVEEARDHYWVQWWRDGEWVDLDPSFASATPGTAYATSAATFDALPETLFHRVSLTVRVEEYRGAQPSTRDVLSYSTTAADLSGTDLVLVHVTERSRQGAAGSGLGAFAPAAAGVTGQVKPLLMVKGRPVEGSPFWPRAPHRGSGLGFGGLLGGGEEAEPAPEVAVAVAEFLQFEFVAPGGARESVVREIYDLAGPALRGKGETLKASDVAARTGGGGAPRLTETFHDLFFTTGSLHGAHFENVVLPADPTPGDLVDVAASLQLANVLLASTSDAAIGRIAVPGQGVCRFYLDSPRLHVAELRLGANGMRLSMDLRRDRARAVGSGMRKEHLFAAQVLRGVVDGHLERAVVDYLGGTDGASRTGGAAGVSTSLVFDLARAAKVPTILLEKDATALAANVPPEGRARLEAALAGGHVALAPTRPVAVAGAQRFAWWQVDPRSGATIAVTDEGLHQATVEINVVESRQNGGTVVFHGIKGGRACAHPENFTNIREATRYTNELRVWLQDKGYKVIVNEYWTEFLL